MTDEKTIRIANARMSYKDVRPMTPEEEQDAVFRWRASWPEIAAAWGGHTPTGRQPTGPEEQKFPGGTLTFMSSRDINRTPRPDIRFELFDEISPENWGVADMDLSSFEERLLAQVAAARDLTYDQAVQHSFYASPAHSAAYLLADDLRRYIKEKRERAITEPIGQIGDAVIYGADWSDHGMTVVIHSDGSATLDLESYGGMIGPMSGGKTGVSPAALMAGLVEKMEPREETNDERSWEKLRDRRHGRRKQRRRK